MREKSRREMGKKRDALRPKNRHHNQIRRHTTNEDPLDLRIVRYLPHFPINDQFSAERFSGGCEGREGVLESRYDKVEMKV